MTATCGYCGARLEVPATGRPPKFCSDAHRKAFARDGGPQRPATKEGGGDQLGVAVRKLDQRPFYRDIADGDPCPQDAGHGRMFMLAKERGAAAVQFCAHSAHHGRPIYAYDGVTPAQASRSGHVAVGASRGLSEAPHSASSTPLEPVVAAAFALVEAVMPPASPRISEALPGSEGPFRPDPTPPGAHGDAPATSSTSTAVEVSLGVALDRGLPLVPDPARDSRGTRGPDQLGLGFTGP